MKTTFIMSLICAAGLAATLPASAGEKNGRHGREHDERNDNQEGERERGDRRVEGGRTFSDDERQVIHGYVRRFGQQEGKHPRSLPPGLAKKLPRSGPLPSDWEDKCVRGQSMPVVVYQEARPLPPELAVKLPVPPVGTVTVAVSGKVVRLVEATREILDVFDVHLRF